MSTNSNAPFERPAARYGAARRPADRQGNQWTGRAVLIAMLLVAVLLVVLFAQFLSKRQDVDVTATVSNFERVDDQTMGLRVDVTRDDPTKPAYCILTAIDYDKTEVGRRDLVLPAGGDKTQRLEVEIPTRKVPVSGSVYGCSASIPWFLAD